MVAGASFSKARRPRELGYVHAGANAMEGCHAMAFVLDGGFSILLWFTRVVLPLTTLSMRAR